MIYSLPYILLILVLALLADYYRKADDIGKQKVNIGCIIIFLFFFGFRGFVGDDWTNYYPVFERLSSDNLTDFFYSFDETSFEPGFVLLMLICKSIYNDYHFLVFVCALINCILLFRFLFRNIVNTPLALIVFLCMGGLIMEINLLRNSISILLFVNSLEYLRDRKPLSFFLLNLVGLTFHVTSIIYFPLYFFLHKRCPRWIFLAILLIGNAVFLLHVKFVTPILVAIASRLGEAYEILVESYTEGKYADIELTMSIGYIERVFTGFLIFCYYDKLVQIRKENAIYMNSFLIFYSFFFLFNEFAVIGGRLANLFTYCYWILWIDLFKCFSITNNRKLYMMYFAIYCMMKIVGTTSLETFYYDNILLGSKSYEERHYIWQRYKLNNE